MPFLELDGTRIRYEVLGSGPFLVLTAGGRFGLDAPGLRPLAEGLSGAYTVIIWDRPNCGQSDVVFTGPSESEMWADTLVRLAREVGGEPAVLAGGSAGARTSLQAALRHPDAVAAVAAWWISGGAYGTFMLGASYVLPALEAAHRGGMAAVAELPHWAERIKQNPRNAAILARQDRAEFIALMERWLEAYIPGPRGPVAGMADVEIMTMGRPLLVIRGDSLDYNHPEFVTRRVHDLVPGSLYVPAPWPDGEWLRLTAAVANGTGQIFDGWARLAPVLLENLPGLMGAGRCVNPGSRVTPKDP